MVLAGSTTAPITPVVTAATPRCDWVSPGTGMLPGGDPRTGPATGVMSLLPQRAELRPPLLRQRLDSRMTDNLRDRYEALIREFDTSLTEFRLWLPEDADDDE